MGLSQTQALTDLNTDTFQTIRTSLPFPPAKDSRQETAHLAGSACTLLTCDSCRALQSAATHQIGIINYFSKIRLLTFL